VPKRDKFRFESGNRQHSIANMLNAVKARKNAAIVIGIFFLSLCIPLLSHAQTNVGLSADQMCNTRCTQQAQLARQKNDPKLNCLGVPGGAFTIACGASPAGGSVTGKCMAQQGASGGSTPNFTYSCKASSATGPGGQSMNINPSNLSQLLQGLAGLMKALGGGSPAGGSPTSPTTGTPTGCVQYYQVSTPTSDPCAYYVPNSGSSINIDTGNPSTNTNIDTTSPGTNNPINDFISSLLGGGSNSGDNDTETGATSSTSGSGNNSGGVSSSTAQGATNVGSGANGEIRILPDGTTIVVTNQNTESNSVVAGFLGMQATGRTQPTGIAASWCRTRPWASNFLSFIIPATFFDSLCALRGYQVGEVTQGPGQAQIGSHVNLTQTAPIQNTSTTIIYQQTPVSPPMQVDIWAIPPTVPLGGRTTIFWNSKNAASCIETSPDGSFSHSTLSGGGATVPLSGATVFTISCTAPDGTHATDDVMVKLAL
jgi:hypothetical protein